MAAVIGVVSAFGAAVCAWALLHPTMLSTILTSGSGDGTLAGHIARFVGAAARVVLSLL